MSAMIQENTLDRVCVYREQNVSNNGQLVYSPCQQPKAVCHDDIFLDNMGFVLNPEDRLTKNGQLQQTQKCELKNEHPVDIDHYDYDMLDNLEIVMYQEKVSGKLIVDIVDKNEFTLKTNDDDKQFLAASFDIKGKQEIENDKFPSVDELVAASNMSVKESKYSKEVSDIENPVIANKHVHFDQLGETPKKQISLKSHRMVKEKHCNDKYEEKDSASASGKSNTNTTFTKSTQRSPHTSSSDSNINMSPTKKSVKSNSYPNKNSNRGPIKILRRGCEDIASMEQTKGDVQDSKIKDIDYGPLHMPEHFVNKRNGFYYGMNKYSKRTIRIGGLGNYTDSEKNFKDSPHTDENYGPARKLEVNKEREKQKKQIRKKKRQNKMKGKTQKSNMEVYQRQLETGQMKSMISYYKTESLRNIKIIEHLHKGIYRTMYKANYQNKKVVLAVYDEEYTNEVKLLDMAHMANSYFVLGLNDYIVGPNRRQWSMSIYHPFGDLQMLLSRDSNRHVIGETHAQFIIAGVLLGVDFLHNNGIVHGNLKPSKILMNNLGYPVVTGFVKTQPESTREDMNPFTPLYAAPERRNSREASIDIFSVGIVAYEMITASIPKNDKQALDELVYDPEQFSFAGEIFIHHCLRYSVNDRFIIGEDRKYLLSEEWFSTLDWRNIRRQTMKSPVLNAIQLIDNKATLTWEEKSVQYDWGTVMDSLCPNTPTLEHDECDLD